jgi:hypothetical protein
MKSKDILFKDWVYGWCTALTLVRLVRILTSLFMLSIIGLYLFYEPIHIFLALRVICFLMVIFYAILMYIMGWSRNCDECLKEEGGDKVNDDGD